MELKIYWTDFAKSELRKIFDYYKEEASIRIAQKIVKEIILSTSILSTQPHIGTPESLLKDREQVFRYLVHKNYKIIYWHNKEKNRIDISDVFDTRQNPIKLKRN